MSDKIISINEYINKHDLEIILEVNKKSIEIETTVADQNEEVISLLTENKKNQDIIIKSLEKITEQNQNTHKDLFKIQVLFITGLLSLVVQIIQMFTK